ncbi:hypothetical protein [Streptomyces uncialis]|uniref:hypothetical protein n=1 Tax=Streptomyces uncialis TaxID=1048205 RepID=UPI001160E8B8|nr:hypothetical protein [Streptomyces uncialis]
MRSARAAIRAGIVIGLCGALLMGCGSGDEPEGDRASGSKGTTGTKEPTGTEGTTGAEGTTGPSGGPSAATSGDGPTGSAGSAGSEGGDKGGTASGEPGGTAAPDATPAPDTTPTPDFVADPALVPRNRADALTLARAVITRPTEYGRGYGKGTPYESDPGDWNVLDTSCNWQREGLPRTVLASFTRRGQLPASGAKGLVRISSTVTVHRTTSQADWEMAETLEEALRCPDQRLGGSERVQQLMSLGSAFGQSANLTADDSLMERGEFIDESGGGAPAHYAWNQSRLGTVTVSVVVKGGKGHTPLELTTAQIQAMTSMVNRLKNALGGTE